MSGLTVGPAIASPSHASDDERLRQSVQALEGMFVTQLLRLMRETVPQNGLTDGGAGEEMFTGMLDEHLAGQAPAQWHHGIGEALYLQLRAAAVQPAGAGGHDVPGQHDAR
jgi:flagellar protein FlgJ